MHRHTVEDVESREKSLYIEGLQQMVYLLMMLAEKETYLLSSCFVWNNQVVLVPLLFLVPIGINVNAMFASFHVLV